MLVIVVYDVPAGRTHIYRKLLRKRLEHLQYSVFFGELTQGQFEKMKGEIKQSLGPDDSLVVFEAAVPSSVEYTTFGDAEEPGSQFT